MIVQIRGRTGKRDREGARTLAGMRTNARLNSPALVLWLLAAVLASIFAWWDARCAPPSTSEPAPPVRPASDGGAGTVEEIEVIWHD